MQAMVREPVRLVGHEMREGPSGCLIPNRIGGDNLLLFEQSTLLYLDDNFKENHKPTMDGSNTQPYHLPADAVWLSVYRASNCHSTFY